MLACICLSSLLALSMPTKVGEDRIEENYIQIDSVEIIQPINPRDSVKGELIKEVEGYVFTNFPKTHRDIPTLIVENGLENELDIMFMMAQTQRETRFGTAGAGRETSRRSLFGVAARKYGTYDEAISDYVRLLKKSYLTKGRTEQHLMRKYTTSGGARYAGDPHYEARLREIYSHINKKTNIKQLQEKYKNLED